MRRGANGYRSLVRRSDARAALPLLAFGGAACLFLGLPIAIAGAADGLSLDGAWGNEPGCAYEKTGDFSNDGLVVLKAEGLETFVMACEWVQVATAKDGAQVATGLCSHEGEDYRSVETFIVARHPSDETVIRIHAENGETWNEVKQCR